MAGNTVFIDTNILIYANSENSDWNKLAIDKLRYYEKLGFELWINRQVIREYLVVMSKLMMTAGIYDETKLVNDINAFQKQFFIADETNTTTGLLLMLVNKYKIMGKSIYDCAIVAAIKEHQIQNILTHNVGDFVRYQEGFDTIPLLAKD